MLNWVVVILIIIGILLILVYPKIIRLFLLLGVAYLTIFENWMWGALYIPLLLIMLYYKRRKEKYG